MKTIKLLSGIFAIVFGVLGIATGALGIYLGFHSIDATPVLLEQPEAAQEQIEDMLRYVHDGDYDAASAMMYGQPALGVNRPAADEVGILYWEALTDSFQYELVGDCFGTDSGVAQKIRVTYLDLDSVTGALRGRFEAALQKMVDEAEDVTELYDSRNEIREDIALQVLMDSARQTLELDAKMITVEVTVNLVYDDGQWWIMPDKALLEAISCGVLG